MDHPKCIIEVDEDAVNSSHIVKSPEQSHKNVGDSEVAVILKRIEKCLQAPELKSKMETSGKPLKRLSEFCHLVETEKNYVTILMNIIKVGNLQNYFYFKLLIFLHS